ncbi:hypothetical protein CVT25_006667 [Psilocybe cyanescens]|uniref:Helitron helicase-like domain-containing protein n=1 Tax=Psilocybe cyanescens TaxID=93625 RepID=A0A409XU52_PSICY|nr:hypothetical protein CVT25_006667 [Psilocybe cyanescens]
MPLQPPPPALPVPFQPPPVLPVPLQPPPLLLPAPLPFQPPIDQPLLRAARQPFSHNWPVHNLGKMDIKCPKCGALHWMAEHISHSSDNSPTFGMCCFSGKIVLPKLDYPPQELDALLRNNIPQSKNFRNHIRQYNNALAMTSLGVTVDHAINNRPGPYVFKVQGRLTHQAGSLLPQIGVTPLYAQLYIFDPAEALNFRMQHPANSGLDRTTMSILQDMLHRSHSGVRLYKQAFEITRNMPMDQQCTIALRYERETDCRRYNVPSAASNEVAVILPGNGDEVYPNGRDVVLRRRAGERLETISELHPLYLPLYYVLLFPTGQLGWHPKIPFREAEEIDDDPPAAEKAPNEDHDEDAIEAPPSKKRKYITQTEYFRYRLHPREATNESQHLFLAEKLLQEFIVDCWAASEQN